MDINSIDKSLQQTSVLKLKTNKKFNSIDECFLYLLTLKKDGYLPKVSNHQDAQYKIGYSITLIHRVLRHYFSDVSIKDIIRLIEKYSDELRVQYCNKTRQTVVRRLAPNKQDLVYLDKNWHIKLYESEKYNTLAEEIACGNAIAKISV